MHSEYIEKFEIGERYKDDLWLDTVYEVIDIKEEDGVEKVFFQEIKTGKIFSKRSSIAGYLTLTKI